MMLAGRGLAKVITGGQNTAAANEPYRWIANGYVLGLPVVFLLARRDRAWCVGDPCDRSASA